MPPARSHARKAPDERKRQLVESAIEVLAEGGTAPVVITVDLDLSHVDDARRKIPALTHDRPFEGP